MFLYILVDSLDWDIPVAQYLLKANKIEFHSDGLPDNIGQLGCHIDEGEHRKGQVRVRGIGFENQCQSYTEDDHQEQNGLENQVQKSVHLQEGKVRLL